MSFDKLPTWGNSGWRWGGAVCQCTSGTSSLRSWCAGIQSWCTSASQVFRLQCACMFFVCLFFCMVITIKIEQIMNFEFSIFFAGIRVTKKLWNCLYSLSLSANHLALAALSWKKCIGLIHNKRHSHGESKQLIDCFTCASQSPAKGHDQPIDCVGSTRFCRKCSSRLWARERVLHSILHWILFWQLTLL